MQLARRIALSPGALALTLCVLVVCLWTFWGVAEMFHEGWYAPFEWLFFLLPAGVSLALTLVALTWPRIGGWIFIGAGFAFYAWALASTAARVGLNLWTVISWLPVSGLLAVVGAFFLRAARRSDPLFSADSHWWRRHLRYLIAIGAPLLIGLGTAAGPAMRMVRRVDDGNYGARLIQGNGVTLIWAPAGPGWQRDITWNEIALYGLPPVGFDGKAAGRNGQCTPAGSDGCASAADMQQFNVCRYLSDDGMRLDTTVQGYWRMPSTDEVVRSLVTHGEHAGCTWNGGVGGQPCATLPDKETLLWNPGFPVIYLWTADEAGPSEAYDVTYNGAVRAMPKFTALGSQGYRCVRTP